MVHCFHKEVMALGKRRIRFRGVLLLGVVVLLLGASVLLGTGCLIRKYAGIPCPGCGLTRAWRSFFRLDPVSALQYHPMFWSIPVFGLFVLFDGKLLSHEKANSILLYGLTAAYIGCYVIRLIGFLGGS